MKRLLFIFTLLLFILDSIFAGELIRGVQYLAPNGSFSETSDLYIQNGRISKISPSKTEDLIRYVIPSFCDAYVTLGADAVGGQNDLQGIKTALKSLLLHGFTHIQSVADGPWIYKIKSDVDSGKILGPKIIISGKPMIPKSSETRDISDLLYFTVDKNDLALFELARQVADNSNSINIFSRHNDDEVFYFDSEILNQMRLKAKDKNKFLTIHTFADRISILDALISGNRYIAHPISFKMQSEIALQHIEELHLIPILNVYRNLHFNDKEEGDGLHELAFLRKNSSFFNEYYASSYESNLKSNQEQGNIETKETEYKSYVKFIKKNPILKDDLILGSGAGNRLSFPGVSGIQELKILSKILELDESFFYIPTRNSCSYLQQHYKGILTVGSEANLLVLKENPVKNINTLFQIEQVFQDGKPVGFNLPAKKIYKKK